MFTTGFVDGVKQGLKVVRENTYLAEAALDEGDLMGMQKTIALLVGHAIHCEAVVAAKVAYELSEMEKENIKSES